MMYSKHNDHSLVLNKSSNTMIIWLKVMFELSLDLHGQCYSGCDNHPWVIENKGEFCLFVPEEIIYSITVVKRVRPSPYATGVPNSQVCVIIAPASTDVLAT